MIGKLFFVAGMITLGCTASGQDSVRRSLPSPLPAPPFPTSDWDGAPLVGPGMPIPGAATAQGFVNYFHILMSPKDYVSIRNDLLNDPQANRTGFNTLYTSHTIGYIRYFTTEIRIRPELRYEQAWADGVAPYNNGTKKRQYTAAMDLIVRFCAGLRRSKRTQ